MRLVERDLQMFESLARFYYLTARQLALLFSVDIRRMNRRLKKLADAGYVEHIQRFSKSVMGKGEYVYFISERASRDLEHFIPDNYFRPYLESDRRISLMALEHTLKTNDFLIAAVVSAKITAGKYNILFITEHLKHKVNNRIISYINDTVLSPDGNKYGFTPDAVMCVENDLNRKLLFFIETDRGNEIVSSKSGNYDVSKKLSVYGHYFDSRGYERYFSEFGYSFSGFRVLLWTSTELRMKNILKMCAGHQDFSFVWVTTFQNVSIQDFFLPIWRNCADDKLHSIV